MSEARWEATLDRALELTVLLGRDMTEQLARIGLTESRTHLLWELGQRGPCKQQDLARAMGVTPRTITSLIDGLVGTGFVTREPHPTDRRASLVTPTSRGRAAATSLQNAHRRLAHQLFAELPADEVKCFDDVLGQVIERLRSHLRQPPERRLAAIADSPKARGRA